MDELRALGGDPRILERLKTHPTLATIKRLHQEELDKVQAIALLGELDNKLNECQDLALAVNRIKAIGGKHDRWAKLLGHIHYEVISEAASRRIMQRKGVIIDLPEIYFVAACLIPYMASLGRKSGRLNSPKWNWIERWISQEAKLGTKNLRQLWAKEIIHRKAWPSRTLLYALSSGAAVPFEQEKGGKWAAWATEWRVTQARVPAQTERHPIKLKRHLTQGDKDYAAVALKYVPLVRWDLERAYPELAGAPADEPDLLRTLLNAEEAKRIEAMPVRLRLRLLAIKGIKVDMKAEFKKERDKRIAAIPPQDRAWLKKMTEKSWRQILAKRRKHL